MSGGASTLDSYNGNVVRMIKEKYSKLAKDPLVKHLMSEMEKVRKQLITIVVEQEKGTWAGMTVVCTNGRW